MFLELPRLPLALVVLVSCLSLVKDSIDTLVKEYSTLMSITSGHLEYLIVLYHILILIVHEGIVESVLLL
jgi:hypothetical protein